MSAKIKRIAVLTSGGDAPGMNPCIRAVARTALFNGCQVYGIREGFHGLLHGDMAPLEAREVGGIIQRGGTMLGTARSEEFREAGQPAVRSKGDKARDILAIRRVHGALISYPGGDRFAFYVFEGRNGYLLDFPNDSTDLSEDLLGRLEAMVGENNFRVEPITLQ